LRGLIGLRVKEGSSIVTGYLNAGSMKWNAAYLTETRNTVPGVSQLFHRAEKGCLI
jgi:hypothetical protein